MTDRHAEGIEKAAEAVDPIGWRLRRSSALPVGHEGRDAVVRQSLEQARAAVTAYLEHAFPVVDSVEELDALPVGTVVRSGAGTIACHYGNGLGVVFGDERPFSWDRIALPATVIHRGGDQ